MEGMYLIITLTFAVIAQISAEGLCLQRLNEIRRSKENDLPLIGVDEPTCDGNGNYAPAQCSGSICFCVNEQGIQLKNYQAGIGFLGYMDCKCARDENMWETGTSADLRTYDCASNGNYMPTTTAAPAQTTAAPQPTTQRPIVTAAPSGTLRPVPGAQLGTSGVCAKELLASQNSSLLGAFIPNCDADGKYAPRQCQGSECYCVRKDGSKIEGYSSPIALKDKVTCQCARDKDWYEAMGLLGRIHTCRHNGNYQEYQCIGSLCYCTDDTGTRIETQSVNIGNIGDLQCN